MHVVKKLNHNALLIEDNGIEKIVMGRGIGFQANVDEVFNQDEVDKIFILNTQEKLKRFSELVAQIPLEFIEFSEEMIQLIQAEIHQPLDSNIYIALTDHIYFTIQRQKEQMNAPAIMSSEMQLLYPDEYRVARKVVKAINERYHCHLTEHEVGFITMHIINAEFGEHNSLNSLKILEMTKAILQLIEENQCNEIDHESLSYHRLMIHLKLLVKRLIYQEITDFDVNTTAILLNESLKTCQAYELAAKVADYVREHYQIMMDESEIVYLAIHLTRLNKTKINIKEYTKSRV